MSALRAAGAADVPALLTLEDEAGREPWSAERLTSTLDHPCGEGWVWCASDGEILGHLLALVVAGEAEILTVAVARAHQRRGHGHALLGAVLARWSARGVSRVVLEVRVDNAPARALYASHGFEQVGERAAYYDDGTDALILARPSA